MTTFSELFTLDPATYNPVKISLGATGSLSDIMLKYFERIFEAVPQFIGWNYIQQYGALFQGCTLAVNVKAVNQCNENAYLVRTAYVVIMSDLFFLIPILFDMGYSFFKELDESNGNYAATLDNINA